MFHYFNAHISGCLFTVFPANITLFPRTLSNQFCDIVIVKSCMCKFRSLKIHSLPSIRIIDISKSVIPSTSYFSILNHKCLYSRFSFLLLNLHYIEHSCFIVSKTHLCIMKRLCVLNKILDENLFIQNFMYCVHHVMISPNVSLIFILSHDSFIRK